ncbi:hypothetical protein E2562_016822 [Oryza meyeriana var. granulata]|uniref:Uncharacterized protein n=1 Tax=Oryza meyeriana var. granulata TaxID=110450 RepID=A0A6G1BXM0_9ORYZ|nr:hypothetical protein E2562_016822 [Oryza meyeriana var. granulata]
MSSDGVHKLPSRCSSGNGSSDGHELVVQQVKEAGVTVRYPMLLENNYGVWAVKMKIFMRAQGVWAAVEGDGVVDDKKGQMALAPIVQVVPEAVVLAIVEKDTTKEAWDALKEVHIGEDRVRKANVQTLKRELERMYMEDVETIGEYAMKLTTIVNKIRAVGTKVEETTVVEKLLHTVTDKFQYIVGTIEQWGDVSKMSVIETIGCLKTYEASLAGQRRSKEGEQQLLLTRAKW